MSVSRSREALCCGVMIHLASWRCLWFNFENDRSIFAWMRKSAKKYEKVRRFGILIFRAP